ncbi:SMP-30/gluconolactonase/LRE family protein [Diaphorobacter sp. HDW4A]|uniref:SMP-30/gluconolactonase/LRE family protein n=1 Tax=Diaphorobacter sp. HDW4A TaxID=2714924 RepID=UPI00140D9095|nr:SMP-30/gluconolactonase/LRE family protein [Diaphorobacter sp. HDW4A]QIL82811.1 SMP-30/gluconolactonase/LRE family protein [Diaphorobacter sp. HDW4A]
MNIPLSFDPWNAVPGSVAALSESPFWHPLEARLYWVDIAGRALLRWRPGDAQVERWDMPSEPGCIAPARAGGVAAGLVVALRDRICHAAAWGGALREVARLPVDAASQRANDGKCDALGRLWVGTVHEPASGPRQPVAGLYCVDLRSASESSVRLMLDGVATANGLAWSPDGDRMYWSDTPAHAIRVWDCDARLEPVGAPREFHAFVHKPAGWQPGMAGYGGRPDGATVDAEGNYWCAMYEGARVLQFSPDGVLLAELAVPVQCPTMPCLGGPSDDTWLFVSSARHGRLVEEIARLPASGQMLYRASDVKGLPVQWCEIGV